MKQGKHICETLKGIRRDIAEANEINYQPAECHHEGDCAGTCPKCEQETRWLEKQLRARQALGKAVTIAGLSMALGTLSSCHHKTHVDYSESSDASSYCSHIDNNRLQGDVPKDGPGDTIKEFIPISKIDSLVNKKDRDEEDQVMGEVAVDENGNIGEL